MVQYKPNDQDQAIIGAITSQLRTSLGDWYGHEARLNSVAPEIRTYQYCFMLRYPVLTAAGQQKAILVKIRRHPKMNALHQTVEADIRGAIYEEYKTLEFLFDGLSNAEDDFGAIRPLQFMEKYHAIVMEEYPSRTLTQLLDHERTSENDWTNSELRDAARKTGRWLHYFHHHLNPSFEKPYTTSDILQEVQEQAGRIEHATRGRVRARPIVEAFSGKLKPLQIERVTFSQTHSDTTTNNVLYSEDGRICIIDMKNRPAPVYVDLGLVITYPVTSKPQIFSGGRYYSRRLLKKYRDEIVAGYFEEEPDGEILERIYSAFVVLDKWRMYEELIGRYKSYKRLLSIPTAPLVSAYFQKQLRRYLEMIERGEAGESSREKKATAESSA